MWTLKAFLVWLEDLGDVEDNLAEAVRTPDLDPEDRVDDTKLATDRALALLSAYRDPTNPHYGSRIHAVFELAWLTGARVGGLRALDLRDVHLDGDGGPWVEFRHRPAEGTPLKNKRSGERPVALPASTGDALETYIVEDRHDVRDDHGRQPLVASMQGRPTANTVRCWICQATESCVRTDYLHGKERESCDWTRVVDASKCPSSRSPHQLRTGCVTWLLNLGWPPEDAAERVTPPSTPSNSTTTTPTARSAAPGSATAWRPAGARSSTVLTCPTMKTTEPIHTTGRIARKRRQLKFVPAHFSRTCSRLTRGRCAGYEYYRNSSSDRPLRRS